MSETTNYGGVNLTRHPALKEAFRIACLIEACGASPELTTASSAAFDFIRTLDTAIPAWLPIETAPREACIVAVPNYNNRAVKNPTMLVGEAHFVRREHACGSDAGWYWAGEDPTDAHGPGMIYPTHWMPLPEAPK